jgi:hypothetical protein
MLKIRAALSGRTTAAEQNTSVLTCISRQAREKFWTRLKSSSYAPVEFLDPIYRDCFPFSRKETLPLIPTVASRGGTRPGTRYCVYGPSTPFVHTSTESEYLIATNIRGCVPRVKGAVPKVELQPKGISAKMERITRARHCAVALRGSCSIVRDIRDVATP